MSARFNRPGTTLGTKLAHTFISICVIMLLLIVAVAVMCTGCATIKPDEVQAKEPSWDGSKQNSGVLGPYSAAQGMPETPHWRERYNGMIATYGAQFTPALKKDEGLTVAKDGSIWANHFARIKFYVMNTWRTSAMHQPPQPTTLLQKAGL